MVVVSTMGLAILVIVTKVTEVVPVRKVCYNIDSLLLIRVIYNMTVIKWNPIFTIE